MAKNNKTEIQTTPESERSKYRFALSTGTMGLAIAAQFSTVWLLPVSLLLIGYLSAGIFKNALTAIFKERQKGVSI